jgi:CRISPR-associated exonuclease Cas4
MTMPEDALLPLSALEHYQFCPRQCALIHLERQWADNRLTVEGHHLHNRVHEQGSESRGDLRIARGLPLRSLRLGLSGIADVVEFHRATEDDPAALPLPGARGRWRPFPVEYKRGVQRHEPSFEVQLCAQALCLEEMLAVPIPAGALFYGLSRRRQDVPLDAALRAATERAAAGLHALVAAGRTPPPDPGPKCKLCSLLDLCRPDAAGRSVSRYLSSAICNLKSEIPTRRPP